MKMLFDNVRSVEPGVWITEVAPHETQVFGQAKAAQGDRSVLLVEQPHFSADALTLTVDPTRVIVLNLGAGTSAVVIAAQGAVTELPTDGIQAATDAPRSYGNGDREFLRMVALELAGNAKKAAERLLETLRARFPGDLKRGNSRNFSNTPDNFWYVVVQPRVQNLSVTVRGEPDRFKPSTFELKADRPGYTRFKISHPSEVEEALRLITLSKRK